MTVLDNQAADRYELWVDDELAGFARYTRHDDVLVLPHTEIEPRLQGRGLGNTLIHDVLERARLTDTKVVPQCPFVAAYIRRHPEYADLVPAKYHRLIAD